MKLLLQPINEEIFKENITIRFNNINDGFNRFENFILHDKSNDSMEEKLIEFIDKALQLNEEENSYVDFYLSRLNEEEKNKMLKLLNDDDKKILKRLITEVKDETIYFRLSKEIIPFFTRLSTREIFFCTFYFAKFPCTIWGNYNMKFPVFFNDKENGEKYKNIADECGVEIKQYIVLMQGDI